jgi:hypothetical protein
MNRISCTCIALAVFLSVWGTATIAAPVAEIPSTEDMWLMIQNQQKAIQNLEQRLRESESRQQQTSDRLESNATSLVETRNQVAETQEQLGMTADAIDSIAVTDHQQTSIGGYGELHYNNLDSGDEIDLHRFVVFLGHEFSDNLRFFSELEVEHSIAGDGKVGEVELEQAYMQWDYATDHNGKAGVFIIPVGILNETHEPDTFYGIERNTVEKYIVPATWWEGGLAFGGELFPGWSYDAAVHSGLSFDTDNASASKRTSVRSGRQKVGKAPAESLAYTGRIRYTGTPGFSWALTAQYQDDVTQNDINGIGVSDIDGLLLETNFVLQRGGLELRGLYAKWSFDDAINSLNDGADEQMGWYLEPSYRLTRKLGIFTRYSSYDLTAGDGPDSERNQVNIGLNYWLDPRFVMKLDVQRQDNENGEDNDGFNLGIGYSF